MKLFLDTNIMLDLLGERIPFYEPIAKIATLADHGEITIVVSALSYATVSYFLSKSEGTKQTIDKLRKFNVISDICDLDATIIEKGLNSHFSDFEDALQYYSAIQSNCDILLTRNGKDFKNVTIPIMTAGEYLTSIQE
jgi:predicted nucleic acid-binding protein